MLMAHRAGEFATVAMATGALITDFTVLSSFSATRVYVSEQFPTALRVLGDDPVVVENRRLIAAAIQAGFTVNLSADNAAHADRLAELGIAPVVTVLARAYARRAVRHRFKRRPDQW